LRVCSRASRASPALPAPLLLDDDEYEERLYDEELLELL
jgi:hypothetical protein